MASSGRSMVSDENVHIMKHQSETILIAIYFVI